jgi:hypothetical protein
LFGFLGVLLALPIASVAMVLLRFAHERYCRSELYRTGRPSVVVIATTIASEPGVIVEGPQAPPPRT